MSAVGSNRLTMLAAEISEAQRAVHNASATIAHRAMRAGRALLEAKDLVAHGKWSAWLQSNCGLSGRTAQRYMQIANSNLESATVDTTPAIVDAANYLANLAGLTATGGTLLLPDGTRRYMSVVQARAIAANVAPKGKRQ